MRYAVLRIAPFRALWLGQAISQLGDAFYYVTFMFMVKKVTGSSAMVGYVAALEALPFLFFGAYAGVIADRLDRRRIMIASDLASGVILVAMAAVIWLDRGPPVWTLLAAPFLLSSVRCFFMPAKSAAIPQLLPSDLVLQANAVSSTTQTSMPLIGLGLTASVLGVLYSLSPLWFYISAVALNSVSFFGSATFICRLPLLKPDRGETKHPLADFRDGIRYIRRRHDLVMLTVLVTAFRVTFAPYFVAYLAVNDAWFGGKPQTIAWFEFLFFAGMVVASLAMANQRPRKPLLWFVVSLAFCGVGVVIEAFAHSFWLFAATCILCGLSLPPADIPAITYLQLAVDDAFRGRVNSVRDMVASGSMPIGTAVGGVFIARFGFVAGFLAMGIAMVLACFVGILDPGFRDCEMPSGETAGHAVMLSEAAEPAPAI